MQASWFVCDSIIRSVGSLAVGIASDPFAGTEIPELGMLASAVSNQLVTQLGFPVELTVADRLVMTIGTLFGFVTVSGIALALIPGNSGFGTSPVIVNAIPPVTCQVDVAALEVLPTPSSARTLNVCEPTSRLLYDFGLVQVVNEPPSSWHWSVAPASLSVNENCASVAVVDLSGDAVITGTGGAAVSTTQPYDIADDVLPTLSRASRKKVC